MSNGPRKATLNPTGVPAPIRPYYSNSVRVSSGPLLFVSGQIALDERGRIVGEGDPAAQAEQTLRNLERVLTAHGASMDDVLRVTVYVTDIAFLDAIAPVRLRYFPREGPASTIVEVSRLALPELLVEIDAIAAVS